jgi:hypothetical protein
MAEDRGEGARHLRFSSGATISANGVGLQMLAKPRRDLIYDFLAPPLILATPFVSFVKFDDYGYAGIEIWIVLGGLIAFGLLCAVVMTLGGPWSRIIVTAGLVTLFVDLQFDWLDRQPWVRVPVFGIGALLVSWLLRAQLSRIATPVFATMLGATLVLPGLSGESSFRHPGRLSDARTISNPAPPVVVHFIFDEFIGLEGIPSVAGAEAVRDQLRSFLRANGFLVFGRAYSRFVHTRNAIPNTLNYASVPDDAHFIEGDEGSKRLRQNKYFEDMKRRGYDIHVYQTDFMDFCTGFEALIVSCQTHQDTGIKSLEYSDLPPFMKAWLILDTWTRLSVFHRAFAQLYNLARQEALSRGYNPPRWVLDRFKLSAVRGVRALGEIKEDVASASAGDMFFAHLLFPHRPYVYEPTCKARDPQSWDVNHDDPPLPPNSDESRARRYGLYLQQILCIRAKLQQMFDRWRRMGLYDRMHIIIQGDHGSRIWMHEPIGANQDRMVPSDYTDSFSTLFAVKAPGLEPGYDTRTIAIQDLLPAVAAGQPLDQLPAGETEPYVLLEDDAAMVRQAMPVFGDPEREESPGHGRGGTTAGAGSGPDCRGKCKAASGS